MAPQRDRTLAAHAALAWGSLLWALIAYSGPTLHGGGAAPRVVDVQPGAVTEIAYASLNYGVTLLRGSNALPQVVVRAAGARGEAPTSPSRYRGSPRAAALFAQLAQMSALRALGPMDTEQLTRFELAPPRATLTLNVGQKRRTVALGAAVYGTGDLYAYVPERGAYVIDAEQVAPLLYGATALLDRRVWDVAASAVRSVTIAAQGRSRTFTPQPGPGEAPYFVDLAQPNRREPQVAGLVERLLQLTVADRTGQPPTVAPTFAVAIAHADDNVAHAAVFISPQGEAIVLCDHQDGPMTLARAAADLLARDVAALWHAGG